MSDTSVRKESAFDELSRVLTDANIEIFDADRDRDYIETPASVWFTVDGPVPDFKNAKRAEVLCIKTGKQLKYFAPNVDPKLEDTLRALETVLAKTPLQLKRLIIE